MCAQIYTLEQTKRGLCPYDDKRYLLANLPDGKPNPRTHAYGHFEIANLEYVIEERPNAADGMAIAPVEPENQTDEDIQRDEPEQAPVPTRVQNPQEDRFKKKHAKVLKNYKKATHANELDDDQQYENDGALFDGDADGELRGDQLVAAERAAAARPGISGQYQSVIDMLCLHHNLERPTSPPRRFPPHSTHQRPSTSRRQRTPSPPHPFPQQQAGPSTLNPNSSPFYRRRRIDSSDDDEDDVVERPVWPPLRPPPQPNPPTNQPQTFLLPAELTNEEEEEEQEEQAAAELEEYVLTEVRTRKRRRARRNRPRNPFIEYEAGVDGEASADEDSDEYDDLGGFIVPDNVLE